MKKKSYLYILFSKGQSLCDMLCFQERRKVRALHFRCNLLKSLTVSQVCVTFAHAAQTLFLYGRCSAKCNELRFCGQKGIKKLCFAINRSFVRVLKECDIRYNERQEMRCNYAETEYI